MNAPIELPALSGLDQIRAIFAGRTGYEGIVKTLNLHPVSAEEGFVVFEGSDEEFVPDSPLEESGFEPLVPLLNRHNRRTGRMSPTASIRVAY